ncbi:alpha/beta hydrolase [Effusibacillus dendaii]|uniref:Lysophospholipase n=1 Tax=Effusibacillus dendaii TaxID=2743772 RepID=A0A7I8D4Z9_9BACL|nr:alpha/beta hydrolase [Effusibacillus dendaii]BCJ85145.1 lysophospholipase [Effusibacillus dendaii]
MLPELFYRSWVPQRSKLTLVTLHGAGQHSGLFRDLGTHCSQQSIAVYAPDLRGFGQSKGKRGHVYSFLEYLEDLDHFIGHVRKIHPDDPVFLMGHSMGGTIVVRYGQERRSSVQGAILLAPALKIRPFIPKSVLYPLYVLSRVAPELSFDLTRWGKALSAICQFEFSDTISEDADPLSINRFTARWCTELLMNARQAMSRANQFRIPVLCLCGEEDPVVDPAAIEQFHNLLQVPDKRFLLLPYAKHRLLQDHNRQHVYEHIMKWLKERV